MRELLRVPQYAAGAAALVVIAYLNIKDRINGVTSKNSYYFKPAFLVAVLVYFIVQFGQTEIV